MINEIDNVINHRVIKEKLREEIEKIGNDDKVIFIKLTADGELKRIALSMQTEEAVGILELAKYFTIMDSAK